MKRLVDGKCEHEEENQVVSQVGKWILHVSSLDSKVV